MFTSDYFLTATNNHHQKHFRRWEFTEFRLFFFLCFATVWCEDSRVLKTQFQSRRRKENEKIVFIWNSWRCFVENQNRNHAKANAEIKVNNFILRTATCERGKDSFSIRSRCGVKRKSHFEKLINFLSTAAIRLSRAPCIVRQATFTLFEYLCFTSRRLQDVRASEEESLATWKCWVQCNEFWLRNWESLIYVLLLAGTTNHTFTQTTFSGEREAKQKNANSKWDPTRHVKIMLRQF